MKDKATFNRVVFFLNLVLSTFMGALIEKNIIDCQYFWIVGDMIILVMLYVSTYMYAKNIDEDSHKEGK